MLLSELLSAGRVKIPLGSRTKADVLRELVELVGTGRATFDVESVLSAVNARESEMTTGMGDGLAIPHGRTPLVDELLVAAGVAPQPIDYEALDGKPVNLFFLLVAPESESAAHVKALARIARVLRRDELRAALIAALSPDAFLETVRGAEAA